MYVLILYYNYVAYFPRSPDPTYCVIAQGKALSGKPGDYSQIWERRKRRLTFTVKSNRIRGRMALLCIPILQNPSGVIISRRLFIEE
jgi:hypothetical protein